MIKRITKAVISLNIDLVGYRAATDQIIELGMSNQNSYVCFANVHMTIEAYKNVTLAKQINEADLVLPDGVPLLKALHFFYGITQERIAGMDLLPDLIKEADKRKLKIFFFGGASDVLEQIRVKTEANYPNVIIAGLYSPPFDQSLDEPAYIEMINRSGAHLVFVALGCPKQESWMAKHSKKINAVLLGVGGAFPVYSGAVSRAPNFMQKYSLEWLYRLSQEPTRLFKRYLTTNTLFVLLVIKKKLF